MKIVIVEDDINMRKSLEIALAEFDDFDVVTYKSAVEALEKMSGQIDLVVTDLTMPKMDGMEFIKRLDGKYDIIVITGNATLNRAIESVRLGVKDFLTKPFEVETLVEAIRRNISLAQKQKSLKKQVDKSLPSKDKNQKNENEKDKNSSFLGTSPALEKTLALAKKAAKTDATTLLLGESGVGKELFAKYVHENSSRADKPFVAINMAAIPENLLESELFGYEKGAFTDATTSKKGLFELANQGTLFLDEIGEMPQALQAKLLRVIQEREVMPLGGAKSVSIDVRIISATNADIEAKINEGEFREDVYYRLNTIPIFIPPLRERVEEIQSIADEVLKRAVNEHGLEPKSFGEDAKEALSEYEWPGNIRELISVVERAAILSEGKQISKQDLFLHSRSTKKSIDSMEKSLIKEVLANADGDLEQACAMLGFSKAVLEKKIKKYKLKD